MIPLIRKNIRLLGIGKNLLLFIGCFLFSFSSQGGTVLSFEQHLLSGTTDHYYGSTGTGSGNADQGTGCL